MSALLPVIFVIAAALGLLAWSTSSTNRREISLGRVVVIIGLVVAVLATIMLDKGEARAESCYVYLMFSAVLITAGVIADAIRGRNE